jgi:hypothetical protein
MTLIGNEHFLELLNEEFYWKENVEQVSEVYGEYKEITF